MTNNIRNLIELRISAGHYENFKEIAEVMQIDPGSFSRMINNTNRKLTAVQIHQLSKILGMPISTLVEWLVSDEEGRGDITSEQLADLEEQGINVLNEISELQIRVNQLEAINTALETETTTKARQ